MTPFSLLLALLPASTTSACPPEDTTPEMLHAWRQAPASLEDAGQRTRLALALTACLDHTDPTWRDDIGLGLLSGWMRAGLLGTATLRALRDRGFARMEGDDGDGFGKPFAALMLAEISRTDRVAAWMTSAERETMVQQAAGYLDEIRDYRGYDATHGWRHGVAHAADWLMQLSLNTALDKAQADRMLAAIANQVMPPNGHAYTEGEYERLARPVLYLAGRGLHAREEWNAWLGRLSATLGDSAIAWRDKDWIARRHNLHVFLAALNVQLGASTHPALEDLRSEVAIALKTIP